MLLMWKENWKKNTFLLVIYKDKIIAEKYDTGFDKTVIIRLVHDQKYHKFGVLEKQRKFDIDAPAPIPEWKKWQPKIDNTSDLLHMNSGLQWVEDYNFYFDATKCFFRPKTWLERN
jgi:hypothetical protein